jgi:hypothetical protein
MTMKRNLFPVLAALLAAALACSPAVNLSRTQTGPTETLVVSEPLPEGKDPVRVSLQIAAGQLTLTGGAAGLIEGTVDFNVPGWRPTVKREGDTFAISQNPPSTENLPASSLVNDWNLKLGSMPLELAISAGASEDTLDLSGLALRKLTIEDGASNTSVKFTSANPEEMTTFTYRTGASTVRLSGLGYANFQMLELEGAAGDYTLDFSGEMQRDATASIHTGVSSVRIEVPKGIETTVTTRGGLSSVNTEGEWSSQGDTYTSGAGNPIHLIIQVEAAVGSLTLVSK